MTASMIAVWLGPFEAELHAPEFGYGSKHKLTTVGLTASTVVLATTASQMAAGDSSWWTFH